MFCPFINGNCKKACVFHNKDFESCNLNTLAESVEYIGHIQDTINSIDLSLEEICNKLGVTAVED